MTTTNIDTDLQAINVTYASTGVTDVMDTKGARKVMLIVKTNATTGDGFTKIEFADNLSFSSPADIASSNVGGGTEAWVSIEFEPPARYIRATTVGQDECLMILKGQRVQPVGLGAGIFSANLNEAVAGTP